MIVMITLELPTKTESMDELLKVMKGALVDTRGYAGCQKVETFIDQESQNVFLVEQWESAEHQQAYIGLAGGDRIYGRGGAPSGWRPGCSSIRYQKRYLAPNGGGYAT